MRDIEILARFIAFHFFADGYNGRMKNFIDDTFEHLNRNWKTIKPAVEDALKSLEAAIQALREVFHDNIARKPGSKPFNRAIFDFLAFYAQKQEVRYFMTRNPEVVLKLYDELFQQPDFKAAIERDTAGVPNTALRLARWGKALSDAGGLELPIPTQIHDNRLSFAGW